MYLFVWCTHENICFIQKIKYSRSILQLLPPPHCTCALKRDGSLWKIKNTKSVLVKGLDNNTVHVQQQTPFSNVKSPESPKHRKERVMAGRGRGCGGMIFITLWYRSEFLMQFSFRMTKASPLMQPEVKLLSGGFPPRRNPSINLIYRFLLALTIQCTTCRTSKTAANHRGPGDTKELLEMYF